MAISSEEDMLKLLDRLDTTWGKSRELSRKLRMMGNITEADNVKKLYKKVEKQSDVLAAAMIDVWLGEMVVVDKSLKNANANLQRAITKIKKNVDTAQNIIKAVGLIDDVISIAKSLLVAVASSSLSPLTPVVPPIFPTSE